MIPRPRDSTTGGESDTTLFKDLFRKEAFLNVSDISSRVPGIGYGLMPEAGDFCWNLLTGQ